MLWPFGMFDERVHVGEDAQWMAVTIEDLSRTSGLLDRVAETFARRPVGVLDLNDFIIAEVFPDGLGQVGTRYTRSIDGDDGCPHDLAPVMGLNV